MTKIKYNLCTKINTGSVAEPVWEDRLFAVELEYSEANLTIAQAEAHQGVYRIEDAEDPVPSAQDDIDAMLVDHEYRLTLLEQGQAEGEV